MNPKEITKKFADEFLEAVYQKKNLFSYPNYVFSRLNQDDFIEVLKDPVWINLSQSYINHYDFKTLQYKNAPLHKKLGYSSYIVSFMFSVNHPYCELIVKHADGLLLRNAIESCKDTNLTKLTLKGLKSQDFRVRRLAAKYCPVSKLNKVLKDPRREVRWSAINRLGLHNIAHKLVEDPAIDIRVSAAIALDRQDIIEKILESESDKFLEMLDDKGIFYCSLSYEKQSRLLKLLSRIPKKKIPEHINLKEAGTLIRSMLEAKLNE